MGEPQRCYACVELSNEELYDGGGCRACGRGMTKFRQAIHESEHGLLLPNAIAEAVAAEREKIAAFVDKEAERFATARLGILLKQLAGIIRKGGDE